MKENLIEEYQNVTLRDEEDENLEIESLQNEQNEESISDPSSHTEEEIKKLTLAEDKDLEKKFEINEDLQSSENIPSSENDEQEPSF